jgi:hypothetical protein
MKAGCEVFSSDMRVKVAGSEMYTYPDISIVCGEPALADNFNDILLNLWSYSRFFRPPRKSTIGG